MEDSVEGTVHDVRDVLAGLVVDEVDEVQLLLTVDVVYLKKPSKIAWGTERNRFLLRCVRRPCTGVNLQALQLLSGAVLDNSKKRVFARTQCFMFLLIRWGVATGSDMAATTQCQCCERPAEAWRPNKSC